jgi:hypothetical protein
VPRSWRRSHAECRCLHSWRRRCARSWRGRRERSTDEHPTCQHVPVKTSAAPARRSTARRRGDRGSRSRPPARTAGSGGGAGTHAPRGAGGQRARGARARTTPSLERRWLLAPRGRVFHHLHHERVRLGTHPLRRLDVLLRQLSSLTETTDLPDVQTGTEPVGDDGDPERDQCCQVSRGVDGAGVSGGAAGGGVAGDSAPRPVA